MCKVSNIESNTLTASFDEWFANLQDKELSFDLKEEVDNVTFEELLAPIAPYESFVPETIEPMMEYPSPISYPSPSSVDTYEVFSLPKKRTLEDSCSFSSDPQIVKKRQRQNEAAKRCRQKKLDQLKEAQELSQQFEKEKFEMSVKLAVLEKEKQAWLLREKDMQHQIATLKQQLDDSHMILMNMKKQ
jgi:hypothetical protein